MVIDDGQVRVRYVKGRIVGIEVSSGLTQEYESLFRAAREALRSTPALVAPAIQVVVFGCLWLEAAANDVLEAVLEATIPNHLHADALWSATSGLRFQRKYELLCNMTPSIEPGRVKDIGRVGNKIFGLRDQLVHFKPDHETVSLPVGPGVEPGGLADLLLGLQESSLIQRLKSNDIHELADNVETVHSMLVELRQVHAPGKTLLASDLDDEV